MVRDFRPSVLIMAHEFITENVLPSLSIDNDKAAIHTAFRFVDLYNIARRFDARRLQNCIMNRFRARETCADGYLSRNLIKKAYEYPDARSKLRRYAVDMFLYKAKAWDMGIREKWLDLHARHGNHRFVTDVHQADLKRLLRKRWFEAPNPNDAAKCHYHFHYEGQHCA